MVVWSSFHVALPSSALEPDIKTNTARIAVRLLQRFISNPSRDRVSLQHGTINDHGVPWGVDECLAGGLPSGKEKTDQRYQTNGCQQ